MHVYACVSMYVYTRTDTCERCHALYIYTCMYEYIHVCMYTHVSVCMYIRALTHASASTRSHQHAHMPGPA